MKIKIYYNCVRIICIKIAKIQNKKNIDNETQENFSNGHRSLSPTSLTSPRNDNNENPLLNNPLISEEDLQSPDGYKYDLETINNIDRFGNSDTWYCKKNRCNVRGDKWTLMKHDCKYRNIQNELEDLN